MPWFVFSYLLYYPTGGADDCVGTYATEEEARAAYDELDSSPFDFVDLATILVQEDGSLRLVVVDRKR